MRIAQVLLSPRIGGAERLVETLSRAWTAEGDEVVVLYLDRSDATREEAGAFARLRRLRSALRQIDPDLVISHSALPNLFARIASPRSVPVIAVLHSAGDDFADLRLLLPERLLRRRGAVVAVSEAQAAAYRAHFPGTEVDVIPNGVPDDLPIKRSFEDRPSRIITVARVARQKRPELWLEVVDGGDDLTEAQFVWIGPVADDPEMTALVEHARESGSRGVFAGATTTVGDELVAADLMFHTASREAHSIGILEAAAVGIPVVCSTGVAESLPEGLPAATFVDASDARRALAKIIQSWPSAAVAAESWRDEVRQRYSAAACAAAYKRVAVRLGQRPQDGRRQ